LTQQQQQQQQQQQLAGFKLESFDHERGPDPTIASYNASVVRLESKKNLLSTLKNALAFYNAGVVAVNS
jgi:hypothetical protein